MVMQTDGYCSDPQLMMRDSINDDDDVVDRFMMLRTSVSTEDNGDIELGTQQQLAPNVSNSNNYYRRNTISTTPTPSTPTSTTMTRINQITRPTQIRERETSKSGVVNYCLTSGKEEVRVQTAYIRSEHLQGPRSPHARRRSSLWSSNNNNNNNKQPSSSKRKDRARRLQRATTNSSNNNNLNTSRHRSNGSELRRTQSSKDGLYTVSSRHFNSDDEYDVDNNTNHTNTINRSDGNGASPLSSSPTTSNNNNNNAVVEQYCLQKVATPSRTSRILKLFGLGGGTILSIYDNSQSQTAPCIFCGIELNLIVINFFHWMFRQTFTTLVITLSVCFIVVALLFALAIYIYGLQYPRCIVGVDFSKTHYFTDAFILSWTTLSTCGYGAIQPAIPKKVGDCLPITILMALEGFFGVLIGSLCSAIFFAKVSRIQSFAQVDFSEVVCIRYGHGLREEAQMGIKLGNSTAFATNRGGDESSNALANENDDDFDLPCPILEFRLVNRMHNIPGGEIVDARINVVASIDSSNVSTFVPRDGMGRSPTGSMKRRPGKKRRTSRGIGTHAQPPNYSLSERVSSMRMLGVPRNNYSSSSGFDRPQQRTIPRTILTKLECENLDHPFFKRVFTIRHTLDEYSPLLKIGPKLMLRENNGYWPHELNDAKSVRESIHFDELIIRMTGLSNADANTVFSHTVYDFTDLRVGHQFTHMLYRSLRDGSLRADTSLLSSVIEQDGGGAEKVKSNDTVHRVRDVSMRL